MSKEDEICEKMKAIYNYNKSSKTISLDSNNGDFYKTLLFKFCFLIDKGSIKFESYKDLWFIQTFDPFKQELLLEIINLFICKIEGKKDCFDERIKKLVQSLINLGSYDLIKTFQYLQSIYCHYSNKNEIILFPLFYSLALNKDVKNNLKKDITEIIDSFKDIYYEDNEFFNNIDFEIINLEFLSKLNILIYNMKNKMKKEEILPLYLHLCNFSTFSPLNKQYSESFSYFPCLKSIDIEKQIKNRLNQIKEINIDLNKDKEVNEQGINNKNINSNIKITKIDASTNTDSSDDNDKNGIVIGNGKQYNINNSDFKFFLFISYKYSDIKSLCSKILNAFKIMDDYKTYFSEINKLKIENVNNKILLNKLSSAIVLLENANIFNLKRKLVEALIFEIIEKNFSLFSLSPSYYPIKANFKEFKNIISKKIQKYEENKEINAQNIEQARADYNKLENLENKRPDEKESDKIFLSIDTNKQDGKKLNILFEFLKFFKKYLHKYVHAGSDEINYYLLPKSLFKSDLKYADYMLSLDEFIDKNNDENIIGNPDNNIDFKAFNIYSENKFLNINEVLGILFSGSITHFNDKVIPLLEKKKEDYKRQNNLFDKYFNIFIIDYKAQINEGNSNNEYSEKELDFFNKFESFDKIMPDIITDKINRNEAIKQVDEIKELILYTVNNANKIIYSLTDSLNDIKVLYENTCSEVNKLIIILKFLEKQGQRFKDEQKRIFEEYKQTLEEILKKTEEAKELVKNNYTFKNQFLIDMWIKSNPPIPPKYCEINNLKKILKEFISSVKLDIDYSFDEKFVYWGLKNGFAAYFK